MELPMGNQREDTGNISHGDGTMDMLEEGGCLAMPDSDWARGEPGDRRSLSGMVSWVKIHGHMWPTHD